MKFWRIYNNKVYEIEETNQLGFPITDPSYIPDEYLEQKNFVVMRTAFGLGDIGIISAMPRLLKQKYPDCKVFIPSKNYLKSLFGDSSNLSWEDPYGNYDIVFKNNPFVDGTIDSVEGDIFTDHFRIFDPVNPNIPLLEQMLNFWQFTEQDRIDSQPEIYFSQEEKQIGDEIIKYHVGDNDYGCFLLSNRYRYESDALLTNLLKDNDLPYFYWTKDPIKNTRFNFIKKALNMRNIDARMQLYIKSKAKVNIGNQSGINHMVARYSKVIELQRQQILGGNFVRGEVIIKDTPKFILLSGLPDKWESKTTTSIKFKSELIDFFSGVPESKIFRALEIGSSNGSTTRILSHLFGSVKAIDVLPERHEHSKNTYNNQSSNIEYIIEDVYNKDWTFGDHDVVLIDCVHDYDHVKSDIINTLNTCSKPYIIFDDYGLFPDIKKAIDEFVDQGKIDILRYIGHPKDTIFPQTQNKILKDWEGVICKAR